MRFRLPIPASWQDFEALSHLLWKEIWADPNAQRVGRAGQNQDGLDLVGRPIYWGRLSGVQCKDRDGRLGSDLREADLVKALERAADFSPKLSQFTLATTAPNDASLQKHARTLAAPDGTQGEVHVWSWDEIEAELVCRPNLMAMFYPTFPIETEPGSVRIPVSAPRDRLQAYFRRPAVAGLAAPVIQSRLLQISYELVDNAFSHGMASSVEVRFDGRQFVIEDNGNAFDPWSQLDASKAGPSGNIGSLVLHRFQSDFSRSARFDFERGETTNKVTVLFEEMPAMQFPEVLDLPVDLGAMFGRRGAEQYGDSLPLHPDVKEVILTFTEDAFMSGIHMLIGRVRERLPAGVKLAVSYPRNSMIGELAGLYREEVDFRPR